jgi:hypothetical protein
METQLRRQRRRRGVSKKRAPRFERPEATSESSAMSRNWGSSQCLVRVAATAIATKCVIGSVRGDHKPAANQSDENLNPM